MKLSPPFRNGRRQFLQTIAAAPGMALGNLPLVRGAAAAEGGMKFGVIGSGTIGGTLGLGS
jgi:hypothetical protein